MNRELESEGARGLRGAHMGNLAVSLAHAAQCNVETIFPSTDVVIVPLECL